MLNRAVLVAAVLLLPATTTATAAQTPSASLQRVSGSNVYELAANAAGGSCDSEIGSHSVTLASGENWPDALAGAALDRPLLLTRQAFLPAATRAYLKACASHPKAKVIVLGGPAAVSESVAETLRDMGYRVDRFAGNDRYETAHRVARVFAPDELDTVFVASGVNFADAVAASPSLTKETPLVLTTPRELHDEARRFLTNPKREIASVTILGGTVAVSTGVEEEIKALGFDTDRIAGDDRYETAARVSRRAFDAASCHPVIDIAVASGTIPFGGLAAGAVRTPCEPLLLAPGPEHPVPETLGAFGQDWLLAIGGSTKATVTGIGPSSSISTTVLAAVATGVIADPRSASDGLDQLGWDSVARSVVQIRCSGTGRSANKQGSGFVVGNGRQIVTNQHVVFDDSDRVCGQIRAYLGGTFEQAPSRWVSVTVQRSDKTHDLALLAMDSSAERQPALLLSTDPLRAGETITALGYPEIGGDTMTLTTGRYSGTLELKGATWIKTDTPISPGSSGGPVMNNRREVVGVATLLQVALNDDGGFTVGSLGVLTPVSDVSALLAADVDE